MQFSLILCIENPKYPPPGLPRGRNKGLIDKRNEALCRRWYYWTEGQRLRFDDALKILSEQEFFISEDRVMAIIRQYCKEHPEGDIRPAPKIKVPKLTAGQLRLFSGE